MKKSTTLAFIILSLLTVTGAVLTGLLAARNTQLAGERDQYKERLELSYQESLYLLNENVFNIESNLNKLAVSADSANQMMILGDLQRNCDNASEGLSRLPLGGTDTVKTQKYISQVGDFSGSLRRRLAGGGKITDADESNVEKMSALCTELSGIIANLAIDAGTEYKLTDMRPTETNPGYFGNGVHEMNEDTLCYPELIYDGPFSDAIENRRAAQDLTNIITPEEAESRLAQTMESIISGASVSFLGSSEGDLHAYNFAVTAGGREYYVQTCVCSGKIVLMSGGSSAGEDIRSEDECRAAAKIFLKKAGYDDMEIVWSGKEGGYYYIQLAPEADGAVYYTENVKIKVNCADGTVAGFESMAYQCNAAHRKAFTAKISESEAAEKIKKGAEIVSAQKAVIPRHGGEVLAYEFKVNFKDGEYYIYINAETGAEEDILRVTGGAVM